MFDTDYNPTTTVKINPADGTKGAFVLQQDVKQQICQYVVLDVCVYSVYYGGPKV